MFLFLIVRSGIALSPQGGGTGRDEGTVGGIPFKEDLNAPCPRSGGAAGGAARESENDPGKKDVPPGRRCPGERGALAAKNAGSAAGVFRAATGSPSGSMQPGKFRNSLARSGATTCHDTAGRDDPRQRRRATRSARCAGRKPAVTPLGGRPFPAALGPQAPIGLPGVA